MAEARGKVLVGREVEFRLFRDLLEGEELPFSLLSLHGPGGVGKTTLLRAFTEIASAAQIPAVLLDARGIEATPEGFLRTLNAASPGFDAPDGVNGGRQVLCLDTYETLEALDGWLRDVFLPRLSSNTLVVLAGRQPLSVAWHSDPGWRPFIQTIALRNLSPDDSRSYLGQRSVPAQLHQQALDFTHGHPLALSLIADVLTRSANNGANGTDKSNALGFVPEDAPDVVHALLERFMDSVPNARHRAALEACALVRSLDESLLAQALTETSDDAENPDEEKPNDDIHELFEWLRGLSFIESGTFGIFPHDVAREALLADLRWRNRDRYVELHNRVRNYYAQRMKIAQGAMQQRLLYDAIFLHRDSAVIRTAFTWQESHSAFPDAMRPSDAPALCAIVARHEGEESARIAADWFQRQPDATVVFRDLASPDGEPMGFFTLLTLPDDSDPETEPDPACAAALRYLRSTSPLRPGEVARHLRFWMARDSYQNPSPVQSLIIVHALRQFLLRSRLAFTFFACADPEIWAPVFAYVEIIPLPEAAFTVDGKNFGVYGQDWRTLPATAWLARLFDREVAATALTESSPPPIEAPLIVLSEPEFAASVRDAWRAFLRQDGLNNNPLLRSRFVVAKAGETSDTATRAETLKSLMRDAAEGLRASPRDARGYRALFHTYIQPAPTQEQAADLLDLPFNTYRRHLGEGIASVATRLWQLEVGG